MKKGIIFILLLAAGISFGQNGEGMQRLLYEFPHSRPAYAPLINEFEVAPRIDLWQHGKTVGVFSNIDMEFALSGKIILEAGISYLNQDTELPAFVRESGLELGAYYTFFNHSDFVLTAGLESNIKLENESEDANSFTIEPSLTAAYAFDKVQIHFGVNAEISSSVKPGFFVAGIYHGNLIRPYLELVKPGENDGIVITPGMVFLLGDDLHLGLGIPLANSNNVTKAGFTLFIAIELGEEQ